MTLIMVTFNNYHRAHTDIKLHYDPRKANEDGESMHLMNGGTYNKYGGSQQTVSRYNHAKENIKKRNTGNRRRKEIPVIESCNDSVNIKNNYNCVNNKISTCKNNSKNNKRKQRGSKDKCFALAAYGHKNVQQ